jgi:outer membrane protein assembly factor BamB
MDPMTGTTKWKYDYPTTYRDDFGFDEGPRANPTVVGGVVYTLGAEGKLSAVDLATGKLIWSHDTTKEFGVEKGFFGVGGAPIVEDGRVIANIGGIDAGIVAFDAKTGKILWTATKDAASYSNGISAMIGGKKTLVFLTRANLVGLDPATGKIQFQKRWRALQNTSVNAATPVIVNDPMGDLIFVSAEYGPGAGTLRVNGSMLTQLWANDESMNNHYATTVYRDGILYGFHGRQEYGQALRAVELRTGKVRWSEERFLAGTVMLLRDKLLVLRETGELLLTPASPDAFKPIARAQILNPTVRAYPALAGGLLYARNVKTLVCVDLRP